MNQSATMVIWALATSPVLSVSQALALVPTPAVTAVCPEGMFATLHSSHSLLPLWELAAFVGWLLPKRKTTALKITSYVIICSLMRSRAYLIWFFFPTKFLGPFLLFQWLAKGFRQESSRLSLLPSSHVLFSGDLVSVIFSVWMFEVLQKSIPEGVRAGCFLSPPTLSFFNVCTQSPAFFCSSCSAQSCWDVKWNLWQFITVYERLRDMAGQTCLLSCVRSGRIGRRINLGLLWLALVTSKWIIIYQ